jgi:hypothetical protein
VILALTAVFCRVLTEQCQDFTKKIPARSNREFIGAEQGIVFAEQGSDQVPQGI